jgi:hypothetical protein
MFNLTDVILTFFIQLPEILENCKGGELLKQGTGHIEIVREGNLERIYFPVPTVCYRLSKSSRKNLLMNVDR